MLVSVLIFLTASVYGNEEAAVGGRLCACEATSDMCHFDMGGFRCVVPATSGCSDKIEKKKHSGIWESQIPCIGYKEGDNQKCYVKACTSAFGHCRQTQQTGLIYKGNNGRCYMAKSNCKSCLFKPASHPNDLEVISCPAKQCDLAEEAVGDKLFRHSGDCNQGELQNGCETEFQYKESACVCPESAVGIANGKRDGIFDGHGYWIGKRTYRGTGEVYCGTIQCGHFDDCNTARTKLVMDKDASDLSGCPSDWVTHSTDACAFKSLFGTMQYLRKCRPEMKHPANNLLAPESAVGSDGQGVWLGNQYNGNGLVFCGTDYCQHYNDCSRARVRLSEDKDSSDLMGCPRGWVSYSTRGCPGTNMWDTLQYLRICLRQRELETAVGSHGEIRITVKTLTPQKFVVKAQSSDTVGTVKQRIYDQSGPLPRQIRLFYAGKYLEDQRTLGSYNMPSEPTLTMVTRIDEGLESAVGYDGEGEWLGNRYYGKLNVYCGTEHCQHYTDCSRARDALRMDKDGDDLSGCPKGWVTFTNRGCGEKNVFGAMQYLRICTRNRKLDVFNDMPYGGWIYRGHAESAIGAGLSPTFEYTDVAADDAEALSVWNQVVAEHPHGGELKAWGGSPSSASKRVLGTGTFWKFNFSMFNVGYTLSIYRLADGSLEMRSFWIKETSDVEKAVGGGECKFATPWDKKYDCGGTTSYWKLKQRAWNSWICCPRAEEAVGDKLFRHSGDCNQGELQNGCETEFQYQENACVCPETAEMAAFETSQSATSPSSVVYGFAALGMGAVIYGSVMYYTQKDAGHVYIEDV